MLFAIIIATFICLAPLSPFALLLLLLQKLKAALAGKQKKSVSGRELLAFVFIHPGGVKAKAKVRIKIPPPHKGRVEQKQRHKQRAIAKGR